ncbi:methyl-accepting chemotaxis protein [Mucisphaera sp.]|uniref:methyl-accepting chemotaxis protein n=1 Tax=Mucisphaera sp. TaxID=2913024 RepID=UPI003D0970AF
MSTVGVDVADGFRSVPERVAGALVDQRERSNRLFSWLLLAQWFVMIAVALVISPATWIGAQSETHVHVWAALGLGGLICLPVAALARWRSRSFRTALLVGVCQGLAGALLIHLGGGRIEWHFHVFVSLAILSIYRDPFVLLAITLVVAGDHFLRGMFWPGSIYGDPTASTLLWIEHAVWVVIEVGVLLYGIAIQRTEMKVIAERELELEVKEDRTRRSVASVLKDLEYVEREQDLAYEVNDRLDDPATAKLAGGVGGFVKTLRSVIQEVRGSSDSTAAATTEISASTEELTRGVGELLERAERLSEEARQARDTASKGGEVVSETIEGIDQINDRVREGSESVGQLSERSAQIIGVTQVIQEIAEQTNLLALNAAIEAARAGEHGRGFAVVADEVRKLADRTATATDEIEQLVQSIKADTDRSVDRMRASREAAELNAQKSGEAAQMLAQIVDGSNRLAEDVTRMTATLREFESSSVQVNSALDDLTHQATGLNGLVGRFKA